MKTQAPTTAQIRQKAIDSVPLDVFNVKGSKGDGIRMISEEFLRLMFRYFPDFCEEAREVNCLMLKELNETGYKKSTKMIGGKVYEGSSGWSKDGDFKFKWIIPQQLKAFMENISKDFWDDTSKVRDKFMKGVLKGENPYDLLNKVYDYYGGNVVKSVTQEDRQAIGM